MFIFDNRSITFILNFKDKHSVIEMESLGLCCHHVVYRVCTTRIFTGLISFGVFVFTAFLAIRFMVESTPHNGPLSETSWKRKTMEDFEVNKRRYVYLFNWTNVNNFITQNEIPEMREVGPFIFNKQVKLVNFSWESDKVSYRRRTTWYFDQEKSSSLNINITHLNPVLAIILKSAKDISNPLTQREFDYIIEKKDNFVITRTVRELLFDGIIDRSFKPLHITPVEKFAWFDRNNSVDSIFTLFSNGKLTMNNSAILFDTSKDKLYFSILDMSCSNFTFNASGSNGYLGYDLGLKCCDHTIRNYPISISLPHYLDRHNIGIKGLSPSPIHRPSIIFDYSTGVRMETNTTYQLNIAISPIHWSQTFLKKIAAVEVPMIWYKDVSRMPDTIWKDVAAEKIVDTKKTVYTTFAAISFAFIVIIIVLFIFKRGIIKNNTEPSLLDNE